MSSKKEPEGSENRYGFVKGLKTEWNLFWETILGDDESAGSENGPAPGSKDPFVTGKLETLTLEQVKAITKALSSDRKKLNQRLESLTKEIDQSSAKFESLKLVGSETEEVLKQMNELSDLGQNISEQLNRINDRLRLARQTEDNLKRIK